jgi:cysteine desulfurase
MKSPVYFDYNATTPIDPEVATAMRPFLESFFGNPSSHHYYGVEARKQIELARQQVAELIGCQADEIIFTSGGTESNNLAIRGLAYARRSRGNHLITSSIEHPAVLQVFQQLTSEGFDLSLLPVDEYGRVSPDDLKRTIRSTTILISVMHANNETGTIQPISELAMIARSYGAAFHTDAAQTAGKIRINVNDMGIDLLSLAGHKFYAPKGVGALFIKRGVGLRKLMEGANHEHDIRPGTENILEIAGIGKASEIALRDFDKNYVRILNLRRILETNLLDKFPDSRINGHSELRLPNTLNISFKGINSQTLLNELVGVAASAGAACHSGTDFHSTVLEAMNIPSEYISGAIRFSIGKFTSEEEIELAINEINNVINRLQGSNQESEQLIDSNEIRLTSFTHGLGCACKLQPKELEEVLKKLPVNQHVNLLVGTDTSDDCAVYRINDEVALVQTLDFFTPIVDNPRQFGAIAAANSLSDIYAMGAVPAFALNIVGFPVKRLPISVLQEILAGAQEVAEEAGIIVAGGHSIEDIEPKFGWAVSGFVHPKRIWRNSTAKVGHSLVLTKAIGTGVLSTSLKRNFLDDSYRKLLYDNMRMLNKGASELAAKFEISACTDVTGFGLLGHLIEMTKGSGVSAQIFSVNIPILPGVVSSAMAGMVPGGSTANREFVASHVNWANEIPDYLKDILCDAQTSGGLLIAIPQEASDDFITKLQQCAYSEATVIGNIIEGQEGKIFVF